jgi:hypothetical protein
MARMLKVYRLFRDAVSWIFLAIVAALVGEFAIDLAKEHGYFEHPTETLEAVMSLLVQVRALSFFWPALTGVGGLVLGMWLDSLALRHVRRRTQDNSVEWKNAAEAIEAFADSKLIEVKNQLAEKVKNNYEKGKEAEAEIQKIMNSQGNIDTVQRRMRAYAQSYELARDELKQTWGALREDIRQKLTGRRLIAKGFRAPHVGGSPEIDIPPSEWRILMLDNVDSEATRKDTGEVLYTGLLIAKAPLKST